MKRFANRVNPVPGFLRWRAGAGIPGFGCLLAVFLVLSIISPPPIIPAGVEPEIPFGQKILTVLSEGIESAPPEGGALSIPLTRLDVMVQDGIAFMRLIPRKFFTAKPPRKEKIMNRRERKGRREIFWVSPKEIEIRQYCGYRNGLILPNIYS